LLAIYAKLNAERQIKPNHSLTRKLRERKLSP